MRLRVASATVAGPVALLCVWFGGWPFVVLLGACFLGVMREWAAMCRWRPLPLACGLIYAAAGLLSLSMQRQAGGPWAVFFIFAVVWCSDIGAYAAGRAIGGPRLAPRVSPGKTWSGAAGGLLAAIVGGVAVAGRTGMATIAVALALALASQLGDLAESAAKRHYRVKDSGRFLPGHGGLLDRVDGLIAASVVAGLLLAASTAAAGQGIPGL